MSFSGKYSFKNLFQNSICLLYPGDVSSILLLQFILRYYTIYLFHQLLFCNRYLYFVCIDVWNIIHVLFVILSYMHVFYCRFLAYITLQGFGDFEDGFMLEWGNKLTLGTNYFTDPMGNVMNLEFEEDLIRKGIFRIPPYFEEFYDLRDLHYVCTVFCGDRYFRLRIFDLQWTEIEYRGIADSYIAEEDLVWSRFLSSFRILLTPKEVNL